MKDDSHKEMEEQLETEIQLANEQKPEEKLPPAALSAVPVVHYAGFWMRFWAYLLDLIVIGSITRLLIYPLFRAVGIDTASGGLFSAINIAAAIIFYLYFILMTKWRGQTIGKMVFGLKVISLTETNLSWRTILFREWIGRYLSATIPFLYVLVAFLSKKQGLHDYFADTTVIHEDSLSVQTPAHLL